MSLTRNLVASAALVACLLQAASCVNGHGKALVSADVVATALRMDGNARQIVEASERANRAFALHDNIYKHYHYKDASYSCLAEGTCFANYIAFQSRMYADEFGASEPVASAPLGVLSTILEENRLIQTARRIEDEAVSRIQAAPATWIGDRSARERVWVLRTGFATEPLQDEAIRRLLAGYSGLQVGIVTRERAPEVFALVGERMSAALVRDGRVLKDVTRVDQLAELLHIPHAAARARRYPELQRFDAHMHLVPGGAANWNRILEINHVKKAVVSALPIKKDYEGLDDANALVLETARLYPRLVPFVMISPFRASPLEDLENAVARGARGVKLINGHGDFFEPSKQDIIDPPGLRKMFAFCERRGIPVLWHVSSHLYRVGLLRVLEEFPRLKVILPHMGGYLTYTPETVRRLLSDYPNFYVDLSWGTQPDYLRRAVEDISYEADAWRELVVEFADRFLFGSDLVVGAHTSLAHASMVYEMYENMLAAQTYDLNYFPEQGYTSFLDESHNRAGLRGLNLPLPVLRKVYWDNAIAAFGLDE